MVVVILFLVEVILFFFIVVISLTLLGVGVDRDLLKQVKKDGPKNLIQWCKGEVQNENSIYVERGLINSKKGLVSQARISRSVMDKIFR